MSSGSFESIKGFLEKYKKYVSDRDEDCTKINDVIVRVSGMNFSEKEIIVKKGEIHITANSVIKNELFFYKERILLELKKEGIMNINEIR